MTDFLEKIMKETSQWSGKVLTKTSDYIQSAIGKGEELTRKGKIQINIENNKRQFNYIIKELGLYIFKKTKSGITDFSMDTSFLSLTEKLFNMEKRINILKEDKKSEK